MGVYAGSGSDSDGVVLEGCQVYGNDYHGVYAVNNSDSDGMVLEGIVPADESLVFQDEYSEIVGRTIAQMCIDDPFCATKLPDPLGTLADLYERLEDGHCEGFGMTEELFRAITDYLTYYYPYNTLVMPLIYRMDRCNSGDRRTVEYPRRPGIVRRRVAGQGLIGVEVGRVGSRIGCEGDVRLIEVEPGIDDGNPDVWRAGCQIPGTR